MLTMPARGRAQLQVPQPLLGALQIEQRLFALPLLRRHVASADV